MSIGIPSFPVYRSADEQNIIDELNLLNDKLLVLGLLPYDKDKSHQECVVYCPVEGHGISTKRVCNTRQNTGCINCGTRLGKNISDEVFVRERLPEKFDLKNIIKISTERYAKKSSDRTNMFVTLITKDYTIKSRQKSLEKHIERFENKVSTLKGLHGDYVKVNLKYEDNKTYFYAECTIGHNKSNKFETVKDWIPRLDEKNRGKIKKRYEVDTDPWSLIVKKYKNESKPSQRVKKALAKHTNGLIPETEAIFPNLVGDKASLRIDLYYPIQKVAIEVQSRIHTTEIIDFFGGEEGMILRNKYDDKKRKFFDENKEAYHFYAINGEGTPTYIENTVKEIVKKHFS